MTEIQLNPYEFVEILDREAAAKEAGYADLPEYGRYGRFTKFHPASRTKEIFIAREVTLYEKCANCDGAGCDFCDNQSGYLEFKKPFWQPV